MVEILVCSLSMSCVALRCAAFRGGGQHADFDIFRLRTAMIFSRLRSVRSIKTRLQQAPHWQQTVVSTAKIICVIFAWINIWVPSSTRSCRTYSGARSWGWRGPLRHGQQAQNQNLCLLMSVCQYPSEHLRNRSSRSGGLLQKLWPPNSKGLPRRSLHLPDNILALD